MRTPSEWEDLLHIEPGFLDLERRIRTGEIADYAQIPPSSFSWHAWDLIPPERLFDLILPFLRSQLARACRSLPEIYASTFAGSNPVALHNQADWQRVPILVKDDLPAHGLRGFRSAVMRDPFVLRPNDLRTSTATFGSGGSFGPHTPTFVTLADRNREISAWRRGHDLHGLTPGDRALYTYNTTHKGGQWMQESLWAHGIDVHLRRPEEDAAHVLENIAVYNINALFTVQQPKAALQLQNKAAGINLHSLIAASLEEPRFHGLLLPDDQGHRQIQFIFLGGFEIVPYAMELVEGYLDSVPVATLLGSSEAIPQACSTNPTLTPGAACHHNNLHLLQGPHFVEVVKPDNDAWIPVEKGEQGLLVYTSWARDGTLWIRYSPGDLATRELDAGECPCGLQSPVISNVHRQSLTDREALLVEGCAAG